MRPIVPTTTPVRALAFSFAALSIALAACGGERGDRAGASRDTPRTIEAAFANPPPARPDPLADPRFRAHQGGELCDRIDQRDTRPFADSMPMFPKEDMAAHPTFRCRAGHGRALRLVAIGDKDWQVDSVLVLGGDGTGAPLGVLRVMEGEPPPLGSDFLRGEDLNRDGWMDVQLSRFWGATGNVMVDIFMYDPARARFVRDTALSDMGEHSPVADRPCVRSYWRWGHAGALYDKIEYCWIAGRWQMSRSQSQTYAPELNRGDTMTYVRTTRWRRPDGRYVTRADTILDDPTDDTTPRGEL